jgi:spore maturation protein CgeB
MLKETKTNQDLDFNKLAEMQKENREIMENLKQAKETPMFGNNDNFAQAITEAGIKAAKATHEFNMKEIKARLIADLCKELVKTPMRYTDVPQRAREIAEKALENL